MSYPGQYFPPNIYGVEGSSSSMYPPGYPHPTSGQLHPSVLNYRTSISAHYPHQVQHTGAGAQVQQTPSYYPPPPSHPSAHHLHHSPSSAASSSPQLSPISSMGILAPSGSSHGEFHSHHRAPAIHNFNIVSSASSVTASLSSTPSYGLPPDPHHHHRHSHHSRLSPIIASSAGTTFSRAHGYGSSTEEDRELGEVVLHQPSESERQAMLSAEQEDPIDAENRSPREQTRHSPPSVQPIPHTELHSLGLDESSYRVNDGRYSCCMCMYTSTRLDNIIKHLSAHRRKTASKSPSPSHEIPSLVVEHRTSLDMEPNSDPEPMEDGEDHHEGHNKDELKSKSSKQNTARGSGSLEIDKSPAATPSQRPTATNSPPRDHLRVPTVVVERNDDPEQGAKETRTESPTERSDNPSNPDQNPSSLSALNECNYKNSTHVLNIPTNQCSPSLNELRKSLTTEVGNLLKSVLKKGSAGYSSDPQTEPGEVVRPAEVNNEARSQNSNKEDSEDTVDYTVPAENGEQETQLELVALPVATVDDAFPVNIIPDTETIASSPFPSFMQPGTVCGNPRDLPYSSVYTLRCRLCNYSASSAKNLQKHYKAHMSARKVCKYCGKAFERPSDLVRHTERHVRNMTAHVNGADNVREVESRARKMAMKNFKCSKCSFSHRNSAVLSRHIRTKHLGWYNCALCGVSFRFVSSFQLHKIHEHSLNDENVVDPSSEATGIAYSCRKCWINFPDVKAFARHQIEKHKDTAEAIENRRAMGEEVSDSETVSASEEGASKTNSVASDEQQAPPANVLPPDDTPGPKLLRIDTYKHNNLFITELLQAEVGENNELKLEAGIVDLTPDARVPRVSAVEDCQVIVKTMHNPPLKPPNQTEEDKIVNNKAPKKRFQISYQQKRMSELSGQPYPYLGTSGRISKAYRSRIRRFGHIKSIHKEPAQARGLNMVRGEASIGSIQLNPSQEESKENSQEMSQGIDEAMMNSNTKHINVLDQVAGPTWQPKQEPNDDCSLDGIQISSVQGAGDLSGLPLPNKYLSPRINPDAMYQCDRCNYCTNTDVKFNQHVRAHALGRLICKLCNKACLKISDLTRHWLTHWGSNPSSMIRCDSCHYSTVDKEDLENHMKYHYHVNNTLPATLNPEEFAEMAKSLSAPIAEFRSFGIKKKNPVPSPVLEYMESEMQEYDPEELPIKTDIEMPIDLNIVAKSPRPVGRPRKHGSPKAKKAASRPVGRPSSRSTSGDKIGRGDMTQCEICLQKVFTVQLDLHNSLHHKATKAQTAWEITYDCEVCGHMCVSETALKTHLRRHASKGKIRKVTKKTRYDSCECEICHKKVCNKYYLITHMRRFHKCKYHCKGCWSFFQSFNDHREHFKVCNYKPTSKADSLVKAKKAYIEKCRKKRERRAAGQDSDSTIVDDDLEEEEDWNVDKHDEENQKDEEFGDEEIGTKHEESLELSEKGQEDDDDQQEESFEVWEKDQNNDDEDKREEGLELSETIEKGQENDDDDSVESKDKWKEDSENIKQPSEDGHFIEDNGETNENEGDTVSLLTDDGYVESTTGDIEAFEEADYEEALLNEDSM